MGVCDAGNTVPSGTSTHHMLINGKIRRNVPSMSAVPGTARLTAFRKCRAPQSKLDEKTVSAHPSFTGDKQMGVSSG